MKNNWVPILIILIFLGFYFIEGKESLDNQGQGTSAQQFELIGSSGAAMTAALEDAIKNKEWIAVTGWTPHWKFDRWDLKYLEDPKGIYGGEEQINTIVRLGLKEEMPEVHRFMDNFKWSASDMQELMGWNTKKNSDPYENAKKWIGQNPDKVKEWLQGITRKNYGYEISIVSVSWSSEIASTNVVKAVLETLLGCKAKIISTSAALMYEAIATGDQDIMVAAWLPTIHKDYLNKVADRVANLGPNLVGTRSGMVVPAYVNIDSIEQMSEHADKFDSKIIGIDPGAGIMKATNKVIAEYGL